MSSRFRSPSFEQAPRQLTSTVAPGRSRPARSRARPPSIRAAVELAAPDAAGVEAEQVGPVDAGRASTSGRTRSARRRCAGRGRRTTACSPAGAASAPSLVVNSSAPSAATKRMRVRTLSVKRRRSSPASDRSSAPARCRTSRARNSRGGALAQRRARARRRAASVVARSHCGTTPACSISQPCRMNRHAARWRSQSSQASRSGASRMSSRCRCDARGRTPAATASRCQSWLPRTQRRRRRRDRAAGAARRASRAAVDQVAEHVEPVARRREADLGEQPVERVGAALDVADEIVHGSILLRWPARHRCARAWTLPFCSS